MVSWFISLGAFVTRFVVALLTCPDSLQEVPDAVGTFRVRLHVSSLRFLHLAYIAMYNRLLHNVKTDWENKTDDTRKVNSMSSVVTKPRWQSV